jgi:hypothetical protein
LYRVVGAFTLLPCEKYMLEKFIISLHATRWRWLGLIPMVE